MYSAIPSKMSSPKCQARPLLSALALVVLAGQLGCSRVSSSRAAQDDLSLVPDDTAAIFMLNLKQARGTRSWQKLIEARDKDATSAKEYKDFVQKCGVDPLNDLDSLFLAVPKDAQQSREYALFLRGRYQPDTIVACARRTASERQETLTETDYNGVRIYATRGQSPQLAVLGKRAIVVAGPSWMRRVLDLSAGKAPASGRDNKELRAMMDRTRVSDAFWWAGQVPKAMAERLRTSQQLGAAASLHSISGSVDLAKGLSLHADLDLGSEADASALKASINDWLASMRKDSRLQLMGLTSYVDTIQVAARKSTFVFDLRMTDQQIDDLANRLSGLSRSLGF